MNAPSQNPLDPGAQAAPTPFKISPEDQRVIQECNREAFYARCLPFSTVFGTLTYLATKYGYLSGHASWGATPKVIGAMMLGYFSGKISYQQECARKLMAIPNSPLGAVLRARKQQGGGGFQDSLTLDLPGYGGMPVEESAGADAVAAEKYRDEFRHGTFTDLDTDRPANQELNDAFRLNLDSPQRPDDFVLPPQAATPNSYEEMRRQNREEYERKIRANPGYRPTDEPGRQYRPASPSAPPEPHDRYKSTNIYGDVFDK